MSFWLEKGNLFSSNAREILKKNISVVVGLKLKNDWFDTHHTIIDMFCYRTSFPPILLLIFRRKT